MLVKLPFTIKFWDLAYPTKPRVLITDWNRRSVTALKPFVLRKALCTSSLEWHFFTGKISFVTFYLLSCVPRLLLLQTCLLLKERTPYRIATAFLFLRCQSWQRRQKHIDTVASFAKTKQLSSRFIGDCIKPTIRWHCRFISVQLGNWYSFYTLLLFEKKKKKKKKDNNKLRKSMAF